MFGSKNFSEESILKTLEQVSYPESKQSLPQLGMIRKVEIDGKKVTLTVATPQPDRAMQINLETQIRTKVKEAHADIEKLKIKFETDPSIADNIGSKIDVKNIIAVGSGKGGVGKSTVTVNLAATLVSMGYKVGIMDADIYGPSVGKMFGYKGKTNLKGQGNTIYPEEKHGIKLISFGFLLENDQPVVWRGPMLGKALEQFLFDIDWGPLDFLLIDMPPGTGDTQLSLAQLIEITGAVIVSTPQSVATLDAARAATAFNQLKIPVLGVIENMGVFVCPNCGHEEHIFSKGGGADFAEQTGAPFLGSLPLNAAVMTAAEEGKLLPLEYKKPEEAPAYVQPYFKIAEELLKQDEWLVL